MKSSDEKRLTYSDAGVDIGAGEKAVELINNISRLPWPTPKSGFAP